MRAGFGSRAPSKTGCPICEAKRVGLLDRDTATGALVYGIMLGVSAERSNPSGGAEDSVVEALCDDHLAPYTGALDGVHKALVDLSTRLVRLRD